MCFQTTDYITRFGAGLLQVDLLRNVKCGPINERFGEKHDQRC